MVRLAILLILLSAPSAHAFAFNCAWGGGGGGYTGSGGGTGTVSGGGDGTGDGGGDDGGPAELEIVDGVISCSANCNNPKMVLSSGTR